METKRKYYIVVTSIAIPLVVAVLIFFPSKLELGDWVNYLPHINAIINSTTCVSLILAFIAIKSKKIELHRLLMFESLILGMVFLVSYILYHSSTPSTIFGDQNHDGIISEAENLRYGNSRTVYITILLSHIGMSLVVVPFVLLSFYHALRGSFDKHKQIVKFTLPIWLFVSISGVIVYLLIRPFYDY